MRLTAMRSGKRYASYVNTIILIKTCTTENLIEQEEPGESLSDCDKDDEDESVEEHLKVDDEDESEDGFFVPDGYLSENEVIYYSSIF